MSRLRAVLVALLLTTAPVTAHAACSGYPTMGNDDYVVSMAGTVTAMVTSKANAASAIGANGIAGMVAYDTTANTLMVCNGTTWQTIVAGTGGTPALSAITAATGPNSINNGTNAQTWNWALTGATADAFTFTENTAATGGTAGDQSVLKAATLATSTATPLVVTNLGAGQSFRVNDDTSAGDTDTTPFVVDADGDLGIGTATPAATAALEVVSTTKGMLPPRMTTTQRDAISSPATGLIVFNTTTGNLEVYGGSSWVPVGSNTPNGAIAAFASATCPSGWSEYTAARGRFLRGIDNGAGVDPAGTRAPGNAQADALQGHKHGMTAYQLTTATPNNTALFGQDVEA